MLVLGVKLSFTAPLSCMEEKLPVQWKAKLRWTTPPWGEPLFPANPRLDMQKGDHAYSIDHSLQRQSPINSQNADQTRKNPISRLETRSEAHTPRLTHCNSFHDLSL